MDSVPVSRLRELREERGLKLWDLAGKTGVDPSRLSGFERSGFRPGPVVRQRIAEGLGVTEEEIWPAPAREEAACAG
jgi:transcriptional regulator with XRE-family HTH domain